MVLKPVLRSGTMNKNLSVHFQFTFMKLQANVNQEGGLPRESYRCACPSLTDFFLLGGQKQKI